jgi:hypothetical protein
LRTSFARRSAMSIRRSAMNSSEASVVTPGRTPESISSRSIQLRSVPGLMSAASRPGDERSASTRAGLGRGPDTSAPHGHGSLEKLARCSHELSFLVRSEPPPVPRRFTKHEPRVSHHQAWPVPAAIDPPADAHLFRPAAEPAAQGKAGVSSDASS